MNDGQHRCAAVIKTRIPLRALFVFGVTRESRKTVDIGQIRTTAQVLALSGVPNSLVVSSAAKLFLNLDAGVTLAKVHSAAEIERTIELHPRLAKHEQPVMLAAARFGQSRGLYVALHYMAARQYPTEAREFFQMLADGVAPHARHPVAALSRRLSVNQSSRAKLPITELAALTIKACGRSFLAMISGSCGGVASNRSRRWRDERVRPPASPSATVFDVERQHFLAAVCLPRRA